MRVVFVFLKILQTAPELSTVLRSFFGVVSFWRQKEMNTLLILFKEKSNRSPERPRRLFEEDSLVRQNEKKILERQSNSKMKRKIA